MNEDGVWVSGTTYSPDFATNTDYSSGLWNAFVAKLSSEYYQGGLVRRVWRVR